ncbi:IclR family transcriptional regulator [Falsiroseomonas sp.]|uniref:IclR family transcriptional regulator n=1 Tax=Falsiroseomonas sp. TaxID=2870721 RepID=UPI003F70E3FD
MSSRKQQAVERPPEEAEDEDRQRLYAAPALEKGLDILELLAGQEAGLTRRDIAERLGRSVGEVFRMVECLARRSYLIQNQDTYALSMKLFELAHEFPPMNRLLKEALPRMDALAKAIDQSCHLTVLSGLRQLVVAQVDPPAGMGFSVKIGATLDLVKSASGHVLLAFAPEEEARRLLTRAAADAERRMAEKAIAKVARQGFASMRSRQFSGLDAISYPILNRQGHAVAALTVPYVTRLDEPASKPASYAQERLAEAATELNVAVGGKAGIASSRERPGRRRATADGQMPSS